MYQVYLGDYALPVAPEKIETKISNNNKTITLINDGEINIPKLPGLTEFSFGSLLPRHEVPYAYYPGGFKPPEHFLSCFEIFKVQGKVFDLRIVRLGPDNSSLMKTKSITCTLEEYTITEDADKYGLDVYVDLKLKQYKPFGTYIVKTKSDGTATASTTRDASTHEIPATYTIKAGDSLFSIAKTQLGDESKRFFLFALNQKLLDETARKHGRVSSGQGNRIYPGTVIKLKEG